MAPSRTTNRDRTPVWHRFRCLSSALLKILTSLLIVAGGWLPAVEVRAGSLYLANQYNDEVLRIDQGSSSPIPWATGLNNPTGIAFDPSGNLYVANYGNASNSTIARIPVGSTNPVTWASGPALIGPIGLAFDPVGNLYIANYGDPANSTISRIAAGSTNPVTWASGPALNGPSGLAFDAGGNLYVANLDINTISRIASGSTNPVTWASGPALNGPIGLAFDAGGNLYVANYNNSTISKIAAGSTNPVTWSSGPALNRPTGLAFDAGGNLYVANNGSATNSNGDITNSTISRIAAGSTNPVTWSSGSGFNGPWLMASLQKAIPVISDSTVTVGQEALLSITESGVTAYQWRKNGTILSGATNSQIRFSPAVLSDAGSYACDVTGPSGTVTSLAATLTVIPADYSGGNFSDQDLSSNDFTGANFTDATLTNSLLTGTILVNANLTRADLRYSYLNGADLTGANLTGAKLQGAGFDSSTKWPAGFDFLHAGMYGPGVDDTAQDLSGQDLSYYDFTGANFTDATLTNSLLTGTILVNANLTRADLRNSSLQGTDFTGAKLTGAKLQGAGFDSSTKWPEGFDFLHAGMYGPGVNFTAQDLSSQDLGSYDFTGANFTGTTLTNTLLSGAILVNANLTGANLRNASLHGANLTGATLVGSDLRGADLGVAVIGPSTTIRSILYDRTTKWPAGYTPPPLAGKSQTLTFKGVTATTFGKPPITLTASSSAGLPVNFFTSDTNVASLSGKTLVITGAGTVTVGCLAEGNATYLPAMPVSQKLIVAKASQKITFAKLPNQTFGAPPIPLAATALGGPVSYSSSNTNVAYVTTNNAVALTGAGTTTITATQSGNGNYLPAPVVPQVLKVAKGTQTLTFPLPATKAFEKGASFPLSATSSAGLNGFTYSCKNPSVLQITGSTAKILGKGTAVITVSEPGNANYLPAKPLSATVKVQ